MPEQLTTADSTVRDSTVLPPKMDSLSQPKATETFKGSYNNQEILFYHQNFQTYTLNMAGTITSGTLNTERGYGDDRDATVYVLPQQEQKYFVRSPGGSVYMLDKNRYVVDDAYFELAKAGVAKPTLGSKTAAEKVVKKKTIVKKQSVKKTKRKKKSATKKVSKSKKKKKPAKKSRKKTSKKKVVKKTSASKAAKTN